MARIRKRIDIFIARTRKAGVNLLIGFALGGVLFAGFKAAPALRKTQSYPMMGSVKSIPMTGGTAGCVWKPEPAKASAPLKGRLHFAVAYCETPGLSGPAFGTRKSYYLNARNELKVDSYPRDSRYPDALKPGSGATILTLYKNPSEDMAAFLTKFLAPDADENCEFAQDETGAWRVGFSKSYLETQGLRFMTEADYRASVSTAGRDYQNTFSVGDDSFPLEIIGGIHSRFTCQSYNEAESERRLFRASGPIVYTYAPYLFLIFPKQTPMINPYSVAFEPR